jgi:hypothetical protein
MLLATKSEFLSIFKGVIRRSSSTLMNMRKELSPYIHHIHLNPLRAKIVKTPEKHDLSNYKFYIGKEKPAKWLYRDFILGYFGKKTSTAQKGYQEFVPGRSTGYPALPPQTRT